MHMQGTLKLNSRSIIVVKWAFFVVKNCPPKKNIDERYFPCSLESHFRHIALRIQPAFCCIFYLLNAYAGGAFQ